MNEVNGGDDVFTLCVSVILSACAQWYDVIIAMMSLHHPQIVYCL